MRNGGEGARHLSSNAYVHHYNEGPAERLDSWLADYLVQASTSTKKQLQAWINRNAKAKNSKLGQIFNHQETRHYLSTLTELRPHFNEDEYFSMNFCVDKLHKVNGAVSNIHQHPHP
jgi:hypothetical protein